MCGRARGLGARPLRRPEVETDESKNGKYPTPSGNGMCPCTLGAAAAAAALSQAGAEEEERRRDSVCNVIMVALGSPCPPASVAGCRGQKLRGAFLRRSRVVGTRIT